MDQKLAKTLEVLSGDCRISTSELARKIGAPRHVAKYNKQKLEKQGIIVGTELLLNYEALGFTKYVIYLKIFKFPQVKAKLAEAIKKHPNVRWVGAAFPEYNVRITFVTKTVQELEKFLNDIEGKFGSNIIKKEVLINRGVLKGESYTTKDLKKEKRKEMTFIKLNAGDKKLLRELSKDPANSLVNLAKDTGLSVETIRQKINRFTDSRFVECFATKHEALKVGHNFWCVLLIKLNNLLKHEAKLTKLLYADIKYGKTRKVIGPWNIEMTFFGKDYYDLLKAIEQLEHEFGSDIEGYQFQIYTERLYSNPIPEVILK